MTDSNVGAVVETNEAAAEQGSEVEFEDLDDLFGEEEAEPEGQPAAEPTVEQEEGAAESESQAKPQGKGGESEGQGLQTQAAQPKGGEQERPEQLTLPPDAARDLALVDQLAQVSGMSRAEYLAGAKEGQRESLIRGRAAELVNANEFEDEAAAYRFAKLEYEKEQQARELQRLLQPQQEQAAKQKAMEQDVAQLLQLYPDLQELPEQVKRQVGEGMLPTVAYLQYQLQQKETEVAQLKHGQVNAAKNPGSLRGQGSVEADPFLAGFMD